MNKDLDVLIVGGGVAGCLSAIQIHKNNPEFKIIIIESEKDKVARGVAYAKHFIHQPLNVRVKGMSADPDNQVHFENWLTENQARYSHFDPESYRDGRDSFVARSIYGDYLENYFNLFLNNSNGKIIVVEDRLVSIQEKDNSFLISTSQSKFNAKYFILATGNFLPKDLPIETHHLSENNYFSNPWRKDLYDKIQPEHDVFIVGSGLTAVDIILCLHARNHQGKIHLISRNGYLPLPHKHPEKHFFSNPSALLSGDIYKIFSAIREEIRFLKNPKTQWQDVIDSMRAFTAKSWESLNDEHKKIFLKRLKPYWEIHRHRIPERSLTLIKSLQKQNRLFQHKGCLEKIEILNTDLNVHFLSEGKSKSIKSSIVINCTGPDSDFRKQNNELYNQLFSDLNLTTDRFNLGLSSSSKGELKKSDGKILKNAFCIGSLRKGVLWETTSVSDIRIQAKEIGNLIY